jgi:hypothetical protein
MRSIIILFLTAIIFSSCSNDKNQSNGSYIIGDGQMPAAVVDKSQIIHLVYGMGDSIFYTQSQNKGGSFSKPALVAFLPHVFTMATRGPQVAVSKNSVIVTACTSTGDIFSYRMDEDGKWSRGLKINDADTTAKEGLTALSADENKAFAVWLDLRGNARNKIFGAASGDGGRTWSANKLVYASPDSSVCECCKPSVLINGNNVYVMFRNWLNGNRDVYLAQSTDSGKTFAAPGKLGTGSWKLDGCPMDGGSLVLNSDHSVHTVWRRESNIFSAVAGKPEQMIGTGKGCTIETDGNTNIYSWIENGQVVVIKSNGEKKVLGPGIQPVIKAIDSGHILCIWENEKQIHVSLLD